MSIQPPSGVGTPTSQQPAQPPNQQTWETAFTEALNTAIPLLAGMGLSAIQQATQNAGDN